MASNVTIAAHEPFRSPARLAMPLLVALAVGVTDQAAKVTVRENLNPSEGVQFAGLFSFHHFRNPGIAGGELPGNAVPLAVVAIVAVLAICLFMFRRGVMRWPVLLGFGLLLGGGISNLVDRLWLGYVIDYLVRDGRAFNLADVAIFSGGLIVLIALIALVPGARSHRLGAPPGADSRLADEKRRVRRRE